METPINLCRVEEEVNNLEGDDPVSRDGGPYWSVCCTRFRTSLTVLLGGHSVCFIVTGPVGLG